MHPIMAPINNGIIKNHKNIWSAHRPKHSYALNCLNMQTYIYEKEKLSFEHRKVLFDQNNEKKLRFRLIPKQIIRNKYLTSFEKCLFAFIYGNDKNNLGHFTKSNFYISKALKKSVITIKKAIKKLREFNLIKTTINNSLICKNRTDSKRIIRIVNPSKYKIFNEIPLKILFHPNLTPSSKLIYSIGHTILLKKDKTIRGILCSNAFFMKILNISKRSIRKNLKLLREWCFIKTYWYRKKYSDSYFYGRRIIILPLDWHMNEYKKEIYNREKIERLATKKRQNINLYKHYQNKWKEKIKAKELLSQKIQQDYRDGEFLITKLGLVEEFSKLSNYERKIKRNELLKYHNKKLDNVQINNEKYEMRNYIDYETTLNHILKSNEKTSYFIPRTQFYLSLKPSEYKDLEEKEFMNMADKLLRDKAYFGFYCDNDYEEIIKREEIHWKYMILRFKGEISKTEYVLKGFPSNVLDKNAAEIKEKEVEELEKLGFIRYKNHKTPYGWPIIVHPKANDNFKKKGF